MRTPWVRSFSDRLGAMSVLQARRARRFVSLILAAVAVAALAVVAFRTSLGAVEFDRVSVHSLSGRRTTRPDADLQPLGVLMKEERDGWWTGVSVQIVTLGAGTTPSPQMNLHLWKGEASARVVGIGRGFLVVKANGSVFYKVVPASRLVRLRQTIEALLSEEEGAVRLDSSDAASSGPRP